MASSCLCFYEGSDGKTIGQLGICLMATPIAPVEAAIWSATMTSGLNFEGIELGSELQSPEINETETFLTVRCFGTTTVAV